MITWAYFSQVFMGVDVPIENNERIRGGFYRGSRLFVPLADAMHVPLDQINYVVSGVVGFLLGQLMRRHLSPSKYSPRQRAAFEILFGLLVLTFCFGNQVRVLLLQNVVAYLLLVCLPHRRFTAVLVTLWSMFYLALVHLCRLQYDYGGYTMDISGPVMVQTQRLSSLAFNLADAALIRESQRPRSPSAGGDVAWLPEPVLDESRSAAGKPAIPVGQRASGEPKTLTHALDQMSEIVSVKSSLIRRLRPLATATASTINEMSVQTYLDKLMQRLPRTRHRQADAVARMLPSHIKHAVNSMPGPVEFFAYMLYFHGCCVGPFVFYTEYYQYLGGYGGRALPPLPWLHMLWLAVQTVVSGLLSAYALPFFPFEFVLSDEFREKCSVFYRIAYSQVSLFLVRQKYYFAWGLSELDGISAGMGYTGQCPTTGKPLYENARNCRLSEIEYGVSLKNVVDSWNISTTRWLREVFYDRLPPSMRTFLVFIFSAFWHGFYPGYYMMFTTFALFTFISRSWHRSMRPYFRKNPTSIRVYDLFTIFITSLAINYAQAPFHLLDLSASVLFWKSFYFLPHLLSVCAMLARFLNRRLVAGHARADRYKHQFSCDRRVGG